MKPGKKSRKAGRHVGLLPADQILRKPFNPFTYFLKNYFGQSSEEQASRNLERFESRYQNLYERLANVPGIDAQGLRDELARTKSVLGALVGIVYLDSVWEHRCPRTVPKYHPGGSEPVLL
ncbi:MAG: hypothetical protein IPK21_03950 [Haliscomenobacter sp.]|nr:hypothetical protein [Haliscomenobacter sp.]